MPAAFALSAPRLTDWDGDPFYECDFAILPTGSMLEADQLIYGRISAAAVLSNSTPATMVVPAGEAKHVFPLVDADCDRIGPFMVALADEFDQHLYRLGMLEDLTSPADQRPGFSA